MVASNARIQQYSDRRIAKALGIQPRNLKKYRADIQAKTFKWVGEGRKRRADCLSEEIHPSHYLELTEAEFFMNFKEQHPSIDIGFRAFQSLKPFFARKLKERNTCCCVYHTRIDLMRLVINSLRIDTKSIHGDACDCLCMICMPIEEEKCSAYAATFSSVSKLWRSTVCPKEESAGWHKLACLLRTCKQCLKPLFCPRELDVASQELVKWKSFEYVIEDIRKGQTMKRIKQEQCIHVPNNQSNLSHVQPWKLHKLEPDREENNAVVVEQDDIVYSEQQEELGDMLEARDNLAVLKSPTNIDNEDYYIVLCKEPKRVLSEQVKDGWGNVFNIGDAVVHGIYYAKLPQCKNKVPNVTSKAQRKRVQHYLSRPFGDA
ncbi:hypothetical protein L7F22_027553 [Adiantum nelumboides]|nr:hypothetical protein [Adiantum nelumboides]